jgi:hypothetical protein
VGGVYFVVKHIAIISYFVNMPFGEWLGGEPRKTRILWLIKSQLHCSARPAL